MRGSMSPSRGPGKGRGLRFGSREADNGAVDPAVSPASTRSDAARSRERGQALVEFALIAPLFLVIVVGLIQFGIGLNYWLDLNKVANQGARWGVVNKYPDCPPPGPPGPGCTLEEHLETQALSEGLRRDIEVEICFMESSTGAVGEPLRVRARHELRFAAILDMWSITLKGEATMRIEQIPTVLRDQGVTGPCPA
jgi:TadE-like protein